MDNRAGLQIFAFALYNDAMKIKVSGLSSDINRATLLSDRTAAFFSSIEQCLGESLEPAPPEDYDADLKLIFIASGGSEGKFLNAFDRIRPPVYLLTSGTDNSLAASVEILTWLNGKGIPGEILHGSSDYIARRISAILSGDSAVSGHRSESLPVYSSAALGGTFGVVGTPSDWLIASVPSYKDVFSTLGTKLVDIPMEELLEAYRAQPETEENRDGLDFAGARRLENAVLEIRRRHALDGLTIRCFDLLDSIRTTGCLSLARLNTDGFIGTCEGDIMSMLSMAVVRKVTGQSSFQANPSRIDAGSNGMVLAHCTLPYDMTQSHRFDTHFESGIGVAVKGELREEPVTVFRLSADMRTYWCAEGMIVRNLDEKTLCRTQIEIVLDKPYRVSDILHTPCGNHHIVFYGRHKEEIGSFLNNKSLKGRNCL